MDKDTALRLALEAMEKITKQMLALRDELAERGSRPKNNLVHQKLWDSSFDVYINCAIPTAEAIKAVQEAKVEPVAWVYPEFWRHLENLNCGTAYRLSGIGRQPLYTTPPQRKPLTRQQINQMMADAGWQNSAIRQADLDKVEKVARAIEAAHSIKGEA
jgi:hypothetical protein